jgi:hypothetical protein
MEQERRHQGMASARKIRHLFISSTHDVASEIAQLEEGRPCAGNALPVCIQRAATRLNAHHNLSNVSYKHIEPNCVRRSHLPRWKWGQAREAADRPDAPLAGLEGEAHIRSRSFDDEPLKHAPPPLHAKDCPSCVST